MSKNIKKIYIAGALTHGSESQKKIYEKIAEICMEYCGDVYVPHLGGTDPVKNPVVTPRDVWRKNYGIVSSSSLVVAYVGEPSLGVGSELEIARSADAKLILWWFKGQKVSRMALGNEAAKIQIEVGNEKELYDQIRKVLPII